MPTLRHNGIDLYYETAGQGEALLLLHGLGSVSYTHLRAHETVLDLVCRLLLEKTKQRISDKGQRVI